MVNPVKIEDNAAGKMIFRNKVNVLTPNVRAESTYLRSIPATPFKVATNIGQNAPMKMIKIDDALKDGNNAIAYGINMIGGIGANTLEAGFIILPKRRYQALNVPREIPNRTANEYPEANNPTEETR